MRSIKPLLWALGEGGSVKTGPFGTSLKASEYSNKGVPIISVREIRDGYIEVNNVTPRLDVAVVERLSEYLLKEGDIVVARKGGIDRSAYVGASERGWFMGSDVLRVRPGAAAVGRFFSFQMRTPRVRSWLAAHATGSTMPSLNQAILGQVPVWSPSVAEQRAIAEVLGALDDKIAANRRFIATSYQLLDSLHRKTRLGVLMSQAFGEIVEVGGGGTPDTRVSEYWGGDILWATPSDITALDVPYLDATSRMLTTEGLTASSSPLYPTGSILMTSRATVGAFAVAQAPVSVNQGFIVVQPKNGSLKWWLFHEMQRLVPEFVNQANGATFLELPRNHFKKLMVELPGAEIISEFDASASVIHQRCVTAAQESKTLAKLRDTLLPALMDGTLRVKDAVAHVEEVL